MRLLSVAKKWLYLEMGKKNLIKKINKKERIQTGIKNADKKSEIFSVTKFSQVNIFQHVFSNRLGRINVLILLTSFVLQGLYLNKIALASIETVSDKEDGVNYTEIDFIETDKTEEEVTKDSDISDFSNSPQAESLSWEEGLSEDLSDEVEGESEDGVGDLNINNKSEEDYGSLEEDLIKNDEDSNDKEIEKEIETETGIEIEIEIKTNVEEDGDDDVVFNEVLEEGEGGKEGVVDEIEDWDEEGGEEEKEIESEKEKEVIVQATEKNTSSEEKLKTKAKAEKAEKIDNLESEENNNLSKTETKEFTSSVERTDGLNFSKDECVVVADGSFYCNKRLEKKVDNALFSAPDIDGDLEIFLVKDGKQVQITHNQTDDASPYFDNISNTIVWHRLINDRYQIVSYDLKTDKETILTTDSVNNMEPTRQGEYTVWQRWTGKSWNIVLSTDGTITSLTNDEDSHNLTPRIQGVLVIWNHHTNSGEKKVGVYNLETKALIIVDDPEGMTVDNPRVVLMYDSLYPNGDIVTKGYDLISNQFIDIDSLPKKLPDIPRSEEVKETKALTQTKLELDTIVENNDLPDISGDGDGDEEGEGADESEGAENNEDSETVELYDKILDNKEVDNQNSLNPSADNFTLDLSENNLNENEISDLSEEYDLVIPEFSKEKEETTL